MEWSDNYSIGVEHIDRQHRELFTLVDRLQKAAARGTIMNELSGALTFLVQYSRQHFADEEDYMIRIGYPEYERHKQLHKELIREVTEILLQIKAGRQIDPLNLVTFLVDWLIDHIIKEDKKIGFYCPDQPPRPATPP